MPKKLVLLQTPAHAAGEIERVIKSGRGGSMPLDEQTGIEEALPEAQKGPFLQRAEAFDKVVDAAKAWEAPAANASAKPAVPTPISADAGQKPQTRN